MDAWYIRYFSHSKAINDIQSFISFLPFIPRRIVKFFLTRGVVSQRGGCSPPAPLWRHPCYHSVINTFDMSYFTISCLKFELSKQKTIIVSRLTSWLFALSHPSLRFPSWGVAWTTRNRSKHWKMVGAETSDEEIACILENKDSKNTERFILRLTFYGSICNIVYIIKISNWMSKNLFLFTDSVLFKHAQTGAQTNIVIIC